MKKITVFPSEEFIKQVEHQQKGYYKLFGKMITTDTLKDNEEFQEEIYKYKMVEIWYIRDYSTYKHSKPTILLCPTNKFYFNGDGISFTGEVIDTSTNVLVKPITINWWDIIKIVTKK